SASSALDKQVALIPTNVMDMKGYAKNRGAAMAKAGSKLATGVGNVQAGVADDLSGIVGKLGGGAAGLVGASADSQKKFGNMLKRASEAGMLSLPLGANAMLGAGSYLNTQEHQVSEAEAKAAKERVSHMTKEEKAARLRQFIQGTGEKSIEATADAGQLKGLLFSDKAFAESFKKTSEKVEAGSFDKHVAKVLQDLQHEDEAGHLSVDKETWDKARTKYLDLYTHAAPREKVQEFIKSDDFKSNMIRNEAVTNPDVIFALASSVTSEKKDGKFVTRLDQLNDRQKDQVQGASNEVMKSFSPAMFTEDPAAPGSGLNASGAKIDDHARAFSRLGGDGATLGAAMVTTLTAQLKAIEADPNRAKNFHEDELAAIRKNLIQATAKTFGTAAASARLGTSFAAGTTYDASYNLSDRKKFKSFVTEDPSAIRHVEDAALNNADYDVSKATFDAMSKESFEKMKNMVSAGARSSTEVKDALKKMKIVLDAKEIKARNGVTEAQVKALLKDITDAATALKAASILDREAREADLQAAKANHDATIAGMDKGAMDKIKELRSSLDATQRYI
ncbi:MAG: hypothetical protein AAB448_02530, partial [Patescibacteria group bacterium]